MSLQSKNQINTGFKNQLLDDSFILVMAAKRPRVMGQPDERGKKTGLVLTKEFFDRVV